MFDSATRHHLLAAIRAHRIRRERDGEDVPEGLRLWEEMLSAGVPEHQEASAGVNGNASAFVPDVPRLAYTYAQTGQALGVSESTTCATDD